MKGILRNYAEGWFALSQAPREEDVCLPLHPDDRSLWMFAELREGWKDSLNGKEIEFEIVRYCKKHRSDPSRNSVCTMDCGYDEVNFAKITVEEDFMDYDGEDASTLPSSETYTLGCSYPDCICQGDEITYCQNRTPEQVQLGIKTALIEEPFQQGLKTAERELFTEDDIRKAIEFGMKAYHSWKDRNEDKFIEQLKQSKK